MTDSRMNFHDKAPKIPPRILCIGMPVRDLTFRVGGVPARGSKENATHFEEICGGNALNAAIGIVRLGGRASICGPMGDVRDTSEPLHCSTKLAHEGIETKHVVHMPGLVTPISAIMIDPTGERTIVTFRDPELVEGPSAADRDAAGRLRRHSHREPLRGVLHGSLRRGASGAAFPSSSTSTAPMSLREGLLNASSHLVFSSEPLQETADAWPTTPRRCRRSPS